MTVVVIDSALREKVVAIVRDHQRTHATRSLSGEIVEFEFESVIDSVCELLDFANTDDLEVAVVIALAKTKKLSAKNFARPKRYPFPTIAIKW